LFELKINRHAKEDEVEYIMKPVTQAVKKKSNNEKFQKMNKTEE